MMCTRQRSEPELELSELELDSRNRSGIPRSHGEWGAQLVNGDVYLLCMLNQHIFNTFGLSLLAGGQRSDNQLLILFEKRCLVTFVLEINIWKCSQREHSYSSLQKSHSMQCMSLFATARKRSAFRISNDFVTSLR